MKRIEPTLASGFRDYLPEEMIAKQKMLDTIRDVFERFGFAPLETPIIEKEEILTGGDPDFNKQIFKIASNKKSDEETESGLAMRFDLTVPLARVVASNPEIGRPFKRYQIGKVFRAEHAQMGRYREFTQCDADIVGSDSPMSDAEAIALIYSAISSLGVKNFKIKVNDRNLLNESFAKIGIRNEQLKDVFRAIDKIDKGWAVAKEELKKAGCGEEIIEEIKILTTREEPNDFLKGVMESAYALGVPKGSLKFDISIARGLEYYTGTVFETYLDDMPEIGSVCSGGRYDGLVERFSKDKVPAVGMSIGVDRLFAALEKLNLIKKELTTADVLILNFEESAGTKIQKIASELRQNNINTEIYLGRENMLKGQLAYGVKKEYPIVLIIGAKELADKTIQVKNMKKRTIDNVTEDNILQTVESILNEQRQTAD